ncbi:MAG: dihydrolipoyllysine-residue acetyltransferase [Pelistega sp.]|nr:dihydrolipoyllysine-residue acetyltransferase [Pelistega sp.]
MSTLIEVKVPDIGDFSEVEVIEVLVNVGDTIAVEQSLITVESDKASMEIPSSQAGVVKSIKVKLGDKVAEGTVVLEVEAAGAAQAAAPAAQAAAPATAPAPAPVAAPVAAPTSGGVQDIEVPDIGDFSEVEVIEVLVKAGDTIAVEQSLITVESDKASMEIPSSQAGVVQDVLVKVGDKVSKGSKIFTVAVSGSAPSSAPAAASAPTTSSAPAAAEPVVAQSVVEQGAIAAQASTTASEYRVSPTAAYALTPSQARNLPHATPSVRQFARELGVDLTQVKGTGRKNRILKEDVQAFVKAALSVAPNNPTASSSAVGGGLSVLDWPKVDFKKFGEIDTKPLSRIKKISGANLHRNWVMIPHVTNNDEADITDLEAFRVTLNKEYEKAGVKFTMLAFLIKAVVQCLKKYPEFNASIDGDNLIYKKYYHIGFAADTPNGLVVPVVRDADKKSISDIATEMSELAKLARDGKLSPAQMQGGCFSISSLGGIGGTHFTPIINAPEVAILGVSRSYQKPVWNGKEFVPRLTMPLSLSYDHRVIDGAAAARFNVHLASLLSDFRRALI